jgi:NAD(P)-dependent dehydrogenase (short-subunit alcohol dehydrogenase family)
MSEQQRVAIVTGAAGGIGRELVLGLLRKEIKVAAVAFARAPKAHGQSSGPQRPRRRSRIGGK